MKYDKIVGLKKQQEKENLEIIQREIDAMLRRKERISITTSRTWCSLHWQNMQGWIGAIFIEICRPNKW